VAEEAAGGPFGEFYFGLDFGAEPDVSCFVILGRFLCQLVIVDVLR
jgi:hypothetical protein